VHVGQLGDAAVLRIERTDPERDLRRRFRRELDVDVARVNAGLDADRRRRAVVRGRLDPGLIREVFGAVLEHGDPIRAGRRDEEVATRPRLHEEIHDPVVGLGVKHDDQRAHGRPRGHLPFDPPVRFDALQIAVQP
jgi:hypothetical protein